MKTMQWKTRRIIYVVLGLVFTYLSIRVRTVEHKASVFLPKVHPNEPWEFVADFSNMKFLNPTIIDFTVTDESGTYDHWKYSVQYSENLSHWPHLSNHAIAHFQVRTNDEKDVYFIHSNHRTCLFMGLYCLDSESEFKFFQPKQFSGATCEETVFYQCPMFLSYFCKREVAFQRNAIMSNLKKKLAKVY
ncbi:uncharacterized protein LOC109544903 isoform X1 [Dendroctonus ponderosae]|uniref:Uncharacterized protein n=2 Tax=Dendroctonus ponderosae TaxID=77166 RepID=U4UC91_DENPD|nr:uncharacterized protein LOC109544903 isoform X1 [Dendroctonus ponderosae]ERL88221.1 hypothetical protein D910_05609 [Dendroctonus ponderosae]KAH1010116.1 hypothetical protein HUJ05_004468 [Dendroctonus ponderosae]